MQKFCHFASKNIYKWPKGRNASCISFFTKERMDLGIGKAPGSGAL